MAFDADAVGVAAVGRGAGRGRLRGFRRAPLAAGALVPSPAGDNLVSADEVLEALSRAVEELGGLRQRATIVLPDGIARLALLELPAGAEPRDYVRFRLAGSLPWAASEAAFDVLRVGRRRVVGAALRRATVARYEQLAVAAGLAVDRVHLAPLMAIGAVLGRGRREGVHVLLGDVALCLALVRDGELVAIRSRRRAGSEGEGRWLIEEAERTARMAGNGHRPPDLVVWGSGCGRLLGSLGTAAVPGGALAGSAAWPDAAEAAWLAGALG